MTTVLTASEYRSQSKPKRNKYGAKRTTVDGYTYDSAREAEVIEGLIVLERAGAIYELERHKKFMLQAPNGEVIGFYEADAAYYDAKAKRNRIIDVKGKDTALSAWKRKHVRAQYGITVEIIR